MSHTTTVNSIKITDINALRSAVEELSRLGMRISLKQDATPRAYYSEQEGMGLADYVVQLDDSKYDIGLYKSKDGHYEARTDFYSGSVESVLGVQAGEGEDVSQARMGKLYQMYAVHAAEQQAFRQGYTASRHEMADGTLQVRVAVNG